MPDCEYLRRMILEHRGIPELQAQNRALIERLNLVDPLGFEQRDDGTFVYVLKKNEDIPDERWAATLCSIKGCKEPRTVKQRGLGLHAYCVVHRELNLQACARYERLGRSNSVKAIQNRDKTKLFQSRKWQCPLKQTLMPEYLYFASIIKRCI